MLKDIPYIYFNSLKGIKLSKAFIYIMFLKAYKVVKEIAKENNNDNKEPLY